VLLAPLLFLNDNSTLRQQLLRLRLGDGPVPDGPGGDRGLPAERPHDLNEHRDPPVREPASEHG